MSQPGAVQRAPSRVALALSPERIATVLSVILLTVGAVVALRPDAGAPGGGPGQSAAPAAATAAATASDVAATPSATPAPPVAWAAAARVLLATDERLLALRDRLAERLAGDPPAASDILKDLRSMNTSLATALASVAAIDANGAPAELVTDLQLMHEEALDINRGTLQASLQDARAYRTGAADVIERLAELETLMARVAIGSGQPGVVAP